MKPKPLITTVLLLFVAVSLVYLVAKESRERPNQNITQTPLADSEMGQEQNPTSGSSSGNKATVQVVAYYFHGNKRCKTCETIEAYSKQAIESAFPEAIGNGQLLWRVINVEESGNDHYVSDFQLATRSVVLERFVDGKRKDWKALDQVWQLVHGDKQLFLKYIQDETRAYLAEASGL